MWRTIKNEETGKTEEFNCCPACLIPFEIKGHCKQCNRKFVFAEKKQGQQKKKRYF
jgi:hypothetical protein